MSEPVEENPEHITHVFGTRNKETVWQVRLVNGKVLWMNRRKIFRKQLLTPSTTWSFLRQTCKCKDSKGNVFVFVFWKGFAEPSKEPADFKYIDLS